MKVYIINTYFFKLDGNDLNIGGIETYIQNLIPVFMSLSYEPIIIQKAYYNFEKFYKNIKVIGVCCRKKKYKKELFKRCKEIIKKEDILLFATDLLNVKNNIPKSISIQHGIYWDVPLKSRRLLYKNRFLNFIKKSLYLYKISKFPSLTKKVVCVDYNYINWYRGFYYHKDINCNLFPILNFTRIPEKNINKFNSESIKIIFARRFHDYRGTRLFSFALENLLDKHRNIAVTFAGTGPDESFLKERFSKYPNVDFIRYSSEDSLKIHANYQIAVVPTLGSEGTSLSLLEAMASSCAVLCTNVGGLTNIVINNYNGLIVPPKTTDIYNGLELLVENVELRRELAIRAYDTVNKSFSLERWKEEWIRVIRELENEKI